MNKQGEQFCSIWKRRANKLEKYLLEHFSGSLPNDPERYFNSNDPRKKPTYSLDSSIVQERVLRIGREARLFHAEANDLVGLAVATLLEDWVTKTEDIFKITKEDYENL